MAIIDEEALDEEAALVTFGIVVSAVLWLTTVASLVLAHCMRVYRSDRLIYGWIFNVAGACQVWGELLARAMSVQDAGKGAYNDTVGGIVDDNADMTRAMDWRVALGMGAGLGVWVVAADACMLNMPPFRKAGWRNTFTIVHAALLLAMLVMVYPYVRLHIEDTGAMLGYVSGFMVLAFLPTTVLVFHGMLMNFMQMSYIREVVLLHLTLSMIGHFAAEPALLMISVVLVSARVLLWPTHEPLYRCFFLRVGDFAKVDPVALSAFLDWRLSNEMDAKSADMFSAWGLACRLLQQKRDSVSGYDYASTMRALDTTMGVTVSEDWSPEYIRTHLLMMVHRDDRNQLRTFKAQKFIRQAFMPDRSADRKLWRRRQRLLSSVRRDANDDNATELSLDQTTGIELSEHTGVDESYQLPPYPADDDDRTQSNTVVVYDELHRFRELDGSSSDDAND